MKSLSNYLFLILICCLVGACSDNNAPTKPNYPPNVFAGISGAYDVNFKGLGTLYVVTSPHNGISVNASFTDSLGVSHFLFLNIYYMDNVEKTGKFYFLSKPDTATSDYAIGVYQMGEGNTKKLFSSYTGEINVEKISGTSIKGSFNLYAKESSSGSNVFISNGTFDISD